MNAIAEKLHLLETVAPNDALLASMLDKVLGAVADQYRLKLSGYHAKLQELEGLHGMSTDAFLQRFEAGDLGDTDEWFDWEAIAALKAEAKRKLDELEQAGV
ncbi:MAG: hypothetical protein Q8M11_09555 [Sulfuritalea sp.]|nr:hypothetical protein [Sulfuritalea sp.]MDP1984030.1 hypothetical protein [Sulfuritalea sp.]